MQEEMFNEKDMIKLQNILRENKKTITTAESCTGGLVAHCITNISGSSDIFDGGIISYSNKIKKQELNVKNETLEKFGAVSKEVVSEMLDGAIKKFNANYAIAISGIAGPTGGTENKPVGTVVIGVSDDKNEKDIKIYHFKGDRKMVQVRASKTSFEKILKFLQKSLDK